VLPSLLRAATFPVAQAMACGAVDDRVDVGPLRDLVAPQARFDPSSPAAISVADRTSAVRRGVSAKRSRQHASATRMTWADVRIGPPRSTRHCWPGPAGPWRRLSSDRDSLAVPARASGSRTTASAWFEELSALGDLDIDCFADAFDFWLGPPRAPSGLAIYDARRFLSMEAATAGRRGRLCPRQQRVPHGGVASLRRRSGMSWPTT